MIAFIYRGQQVQGWAAEPVTCTACGRVHLVNAKTGKVLGDREK